MPRSSASSTSSDRGSGAGVRLPRIVSLVPSSTETLLALGADVVACTRFCEQPAIMHVGGTKNPDLDAIVGLAPDVVVMDREENRREDADELQAAGLDLFVSAVTTVEAALAVVGDLAARAGVASPGSSGDRSGGQAPLVDGQPAGAVRAFVPIWRRPWMTISGLTYGADLLAGLGVALVTGDRGDPYPTVELDEIDALGPDIVLVPSEPYDFADQHLDELRVALGADVPVLRVDGRDLFWWGIRTPAATWRLGRQLGAAFAEFG